MNVASKELCQELHELSGWSGGEYTWYETLKGVIESGIEAIESEWGSGTPKFICPAYDLGYLLRKLPRRLNDDYRLTIQTVVFPQWCASYDELEGIGCAHESYGDSPEDAAAKLCIELFKQGILGKEDKA